MTNTSTHVPGFHQAPAFCLSKFVGPGPLFVASETEHAEEALLDHLATLPAGGLLPIDLSGIRISSEAARQLLRRALLRIAGGELTDRYLVILDLGDSLYNVDVMLASESLVAVERSADSRAELRGDIDPAVCSTYQFLLEAGMTTASMVQDHFKLGNISTATNRLTSLAKLAIARRVEQRPVSGGGREYVYAAVR